MNVLRIPTWASSDEAKAIASIVGAVLLVALLWSWNASRVAARAPSDAQAVATEACEGVRWPKGGKVSTLKSAVNNSKVALCFKQDLFCSAAIAACKQRRKEAIDGALRKLRNDSPP